MNALQLETAPPQEILRWMYANHERPVIVSSFQAESAVLIDLACRVTESPEVITLDTGRLPEDTYVAMELFRERYPIRLRVVAPDSGDVEAMTQRHGPNLFRRSVVLRHECCATRKVRPLARALEGHDAWATGVRREQTSARAATPVIAEDADHGSITKVAPLASWSTEQVWEYVEAHDLPRHPLYARGYTSIGCAPCTRATAPGEDARAGRWWWERGAAKECGLHTIALEAVS